MRSGGAHAPAERGHADDGLVGIPYDHPLIWPPGAQAGIGFSIVPDEPAGPMAGRASEVRGWLGFGFVWTWGAPDPSR